MSSMPNVELLLGELDHARLSKLNGGQLPEPLSDLLQLAQIVPPRAMPADVVTLYSQLIVRDETTGETQKLTLCYPQDAEPKAGFISVLSPVGLALLGRQAGMRSSWVTPTGQRRHLTIEALLFQPEASGDYSL